MQVIRYALLGAALFVAACSNNNPPSNDNNACHIAQERPHWWDAIKASERKWNAPAHVQMAIIWKESSFRSDVRPRRKYLLWVIPWGRVSSAYGFSQALDGTWDWYMKSTGNRGADRTDMDDASDFIGWYMNQSRKTNGIALTDAYNQYLAYHEGHGGYKRKTYNQKSWLIGVAKQVRRQAARYEQQLDGCGLG